MDEQSFRPHFVTSVSVESVESQSKHRRLAWEQIKSAVGLAILAINQQNPSALSSPPKVR